jgi:inner membrane protein
MPTVMSHAAVAVGLGRILTSRPLPLSFWGICVSLAMLPDLDVLAFRFGIPYGAVLGHRGFSHSLLFALIVGLLAAVATYRYLGIPFWDLFGFFFVVTASHGLLDAFTNGGLGVAFFAPFDNSRYFFPWQPIEVSPLGMAFFSMWGLQTALSELLWVLLPTALVVAAVELVRWRRRRHRAPHVTKTTIA